MRPPSQGKGTVLRGVFSKVSWERGAEAEKAFGHPASADLEQAEPQARVSTFSPRSLGPSCRPSSSGLGCGRRNVEDEVDFLPPASLGEVNHNLDLVFGLERLP